VSTWRVLWRVMTYQPWSYALNLLLWTAFWLAPLLMGLVTRAVFDAVTERAAAGWALWSLLALLVGVALGRVGINAVGVSAWAAFFFTRAGLLRRNLLERILSRPGAKALPDSPGEAMSRFRDDVDELLKLIELTVDGVGIVLAAAVGAAIMFRIDAAITTVVLLPLVLIVVIVALLRRRIIRYRPAASRAARR
jgi:ATP-binding cassette subfamily B protein